MKKSALNILLCFYLRPRARYCCLLARNEIVEYEF